MWCTPTRFPIFPLTVRKKMHVPFFSFPFFLLFFREEERRKRKGGRKEKALIPINQSGQQPDREESATHFLTCSDFLSFVLFPSLGHEDTENIFGKRRPVVLSLPDREIGARASRQQLLLFVSPEEREQTFILFSRDWEKGRERGWRRRRSRRVCFDN